jgi:hypothetical protein
MYMNEKSEGNGTRGTWTANDRKERVDALKQYIETNKKVLRKDVYRHMLVTFGVSRRTIDDYIKDLSIAGFIEVQEWKPEKGPVDPDQLIENQTLVWRM